MSSTETPTDVLRRVQKSWNGPVASISFEEIVSQRQRQSKIVGNCFATLGRLVTCIPNTVICLRRDNEAIMMSDELWDSGSAWRPMSFTHATAIKWSTQEQCYYRLAFSQRCWLFYPNLDSWLFLKTWLFRCSQILVFLYVKCYKNWKKLSLFLIFSEVETTPVQFYCCNPYLGFFWIAILIILLRTW